VCGGAPTAHGHNRLVILRYAAFTTDMQRTAAEVTFCGHATIATAVALAEPASHARDPFPVGGVVEDPATGPAAAAFGGYLRELGKVPTPRELSIVQGEDMGRRSELTITVHPTDPRVTVTGTATPIVTAG